jgi:hypothetical protein
MGALPFIPCCTRLISRWQGFSTERTQSRRLAETSRKSLTAVLIWTFQRMTLLSLIYKCTPILPIQSEFPSDQALQRSERLVNLQELKRSSLDYDFDLTRSAYLRQQFLNRDSQGSSCDTDGTCSLRILLHVDNVAFGVVVAEASLFDNVLPRLIPRVLHVFSFQMLSPIHLVGAFAVETVVGCCWWHFACKELSRFSNANLVSKKV